MADLGECRPSGNVPRLSQALEHVVCETFARKDVLTGTAHIHIIQGSTERNKMTEQQPRPEIRVLGVAGSLREGSYSQARLRAAQELAPAEMEIVTFEHLGSLPLYNEDILAQGVPVSVAALKEAIREADALLIVTPEHNYSIPGVLKNAIDRASRSSDLAARRQASGADGRQHRHVWHCARTDAPAPGVRVREYARTDQDTGRRPSGEGKVR